MDHTSRIDKARGLLFGLALGDCLGAPFEGKEGVTDSDIVAAQNGTGALRHTDDTALALVLARHLAHRLGGRPRKLDGCIDADVLAREFAEAWQAEPWRGYGGGVTKSFGLIVAGTHWRSAIRAVFPDGSFGNGGAMRVAPVALVGAGVRDVTELARRSAEVTHAHDDALHGAVCQAVAAHLAIQLDPAQPLSAGAFVETVREAVPSALWAKKFDIVAELAERDTDPAEAAAALGNDVSAPGSVPLALLSFLRHPRRPDAAIRFAIRAGGDTDTVAAMAGALAGAHSGYAALPTPAVSRLEAAKQLHLYAEHLA
ncbi:ADP-ribosylglycohydrolase family protein [Saccharomonospora xinjiangensis]|uniref:ADP-ribosylglycohydrolase family protein n=1 Tax=Saccharomonospora xinjiangensis TaxID=75294 RepID=UPI00106F8458|nr:ADP-ribosylglycohydrolase family protein [Saccharomonospora xinjiangensis]QBQ58631.1 ADP-ribosyl-[dinitrogen reductase] glycohydrolase [Saccharomonospora xinjiangensis]